MVFRGGAKSKRVGGSFRQVVEFSHSITTITTTTRRRRRCTHHQPFPRRREFPVATVVVDIIRSIHLYVVVVRIPIHIVASFAAVDYWRHRTRSRTPTRRFTLTKNKTTTSVVMTTFALRSPPARGRRTR